MKTIVLITRENSQRATHVSVFLYNSYSEARYFCKFVNNLSLAGEDKLVARMITANAEYPLEKYQPFKFDDFVKLNNRTMQILMRETDSRILAVALKDTKKEVKDCFFRNMCKRAESMLKEDRDNWEEPVIESEKESARQVILDIYDDLTRENRFDEAWASYKNLKENDRKNKEDFDNENHIVLAFRGFGNIADLVSVYIFDDYNSADNFCYYLNSLEPEKGTFFYVKHAEQMIEYETIKPLLVSFDEIFDYSKKYNINYIIREALKKFDSYTILKAFKGMDKHSRTLIMQSLPTKTTDDINDMIENSDKYNTALILLYQIREAQQRILNAINKTAVKYRQGKLAHGKEVLKD